MSGLLSFVDLYRPVLPAGVLVVLLAAAGAAAVWRSARVDREMAGPGRALGWLVLRGVAIAAAGWVLAGPSVLEREPVPREQAGTVTLLVDTSASMAEADVPGDDGRAETRWQALVRTWLDAARLDPLAEAARLQVLGFDERVQSLDPADLATYEPAGRETKLFAALDEALADPALRDDAAPVLVVLSDGHDTQRGRDPAVARRLAERGATVHVVPVGSVAASPSVAVQAWVDADVLFDGDTTTLHAQLWPRGVGERDVDVQLHHEGEHVETQRVRLAADAPPEPVAFEIAPAAAPQQPVTMHGYEVSLASADGDDGDDDDAELFDAPVARQSVFVQVSREQLRVALFEGEPYWDTRWLARVLRDDAQVQLHAVYHVAAGRRIVQRPPASDVAFDPDHLDADALSRFDVIVLGKRAERFFPGEAAQDLVDYVREQGGALVLARGRPFDVNTAAGEAAMAVFDPIAPVTWGERQVASLALRLTPEGAASPLLRFDELADPDVLTTQLPGMLAATQVQRERAASVVWLRQAPADDDSPGMAAVVQLNVGRGRVLAVLTDGLWRWALLPSELRAYETVYHLFWSRAVRWLAGDGAFLPGQDVSLALDRLAVEPGEAVPVTVSTRYVAPDFEPRLRVTDPQGETRTLALQRDDRRAVSFHASYASDVPGVHRFTLDDAGPAGLIDADTPPTARLAVEDRSPEQLDRSARPAVLAELAEATGGEQFGLDEAGRLRTLVQDRTLARAVDPRPRYVFARWPVLVLIVGCLVLEWWLRRRAGLV